MARVNVEQAALTDPRYALLGSLLGENKYAALGRMIYLWNYCQETSSYVLKPEIVNFIFDNLTGMSEALLKSGLGQKHRHGIYISGTKGRIEWLQVKRDNGKKGGRPKRNLPETKTITEPKPIGSPSANPPAPAPAPAPTKELKNPPKPPRKRRGESPFLTDPPDLAEVEAFCTQMNSPFDGQYYLDKMANCGWTHSGGKMPVLNWKAQVRTWTKPGGEPPLELQERRRQKALADCPPAPWWPPNTEAADKVRDVPNRVVPLSDDEYNRIADWEGFNKWRYGRPREEWQRPDILAMASKAKEYLHSRYPL